jgi:predicted 3-demethylubiquinone-9 3-methyltransferase (glyoxalase superfamily)
MPKVSTFLWFNDKAEEAARFYTSLFPNAKIGSVTRSGASGPGAPGAVMSVDFEIGGQAFIALNGGPHFTFTPAISLFVHCTTQEEVDHYWEKLSAGGQTQPCGWLQDRYGLSWQVVPRVLGQYLQDKDPARARRVMDAMLKMSKIDIAGLERAYEG